MARMNHTSDTKGAWEEVSSLLPAFLKERELTEDESYTERIYRCSVEDDRRLDVVYDTWEGWQIVRYFFVSYAYEVVDIIEHTQYWFKDGKRVSVELCEMGRMACYCDSVRGTSDYCLWGGPSLPMIGDYRLWDGCRFTESNAKARLGEFAEGHGGRISAWDIVGDYAGGIMETLHKVGKGAWIDMIFVHCTDAREWIAGHAHVLRLALRHGHELTGIDIDQANFLEELGMDTHNPTLLFPDDGGEMHAMLSRRVIRKREEAKRKAEEEERRRIAERNKRIIEKRMEVWGGFRIEGDKFVLIPLITYDDYKDEGNVMHHCVATYFTQEQSLIMTAVDKETGRHVETMEWRGKEMVQCRGLQNSRTEWHDEIVGMVMAHAKELTAMSRRMAS